MDKVNRRYKAILALLIFTAIFLSTLSVQAKEQITENQDGSITVSKEALAEWLQLRALQDIKQRELDRQIKEIEKKLTYKCS